jgi:hypothetical protein
LDLVLPILTTPNKEDEMAKQKTPVQLAAALVRGLKGADVERSDVARGDVSVWTLRVGKRIVARLVARRTVVRCYLKHALPAGAELPGEAGLARHGRGGDRNWEVGFTATEETAGETRAILEAAIVAAAS